jgi:hypothetical protein
MNAPYCPAPRRERRVLRFFGELIHGGLFLAAVVLILSTLALVLNAPGGVYLR